MASALKRKLSGSADGKGVLVVATATPGTLIHTAVAGVVAGTLDEIWLYAQNTSASSVKLTIEYGTTTAPDGHIEATIAGESGLVQIIPGLVLQNAQVVRAFADVASVIVIHGFVNAITD